MPFLGQDWRGPGHQWKKSASTSTGWEIHEPQIGVLLDTIPRYHVKKIIEAFLLERQQKKYRGSYTPLSSAPVSKCSVREKMSWLQVGFKGSKECHGYTTLGEMIRRLDLAASASNANRFPYLLQFTLLVVQHKLINLSGSAQSQVFRLTEALLIKVIESRRGIRQMAHILDRMMLTLQAQSRTKLFSSKTIWLSKLETVRRWRTLLKVMKVPQRMDNRLTLSNLPVELQRTVVSYLNDYEDINSLSRVNTTLHKICEDVSVWKSLCYRNFTEEEVNSGKLALQRTAHQEKQLRIDFSTNESWKALHAHLLTTYVAIEETYSDPLLFCRHCSILFWKDTGHPCITEVKDMSLEVQKLSPRQLLKFFET